MGFWVVVPPRDRSGQVRREGWGVWDGLLLCCLIARWVEREAARVGVGLKCIKGSVQGRHGDRLIRVGGRTSRSGYQLLGQPYAG
jgi:hypothetical protein